MANEDLLLRQMPHSLEGEQAVLGSMLIDEGCVKDVMDKLVPSDFYLRQNREIFETIYTMFTYARPIDGITVCEEMQKAGTYDENTTRSYLAQLMEITPTSANVMEYVAIVRDKALLRGVAQAAGEITVLVQEGIGEAAAILEEHKETLEKMTEERKALSEENAQTQIKAETASARREINKALSAEQLTIKRDWTRKQNELKEKIFSEVKGLLESFTKTPEYENYLTAKIKEALDFAGNDEITIYLSPEDRSLAEKLQHTTGTAIQLAKDSFLGGIRATIPQKNILIDHSFAGNFEAAYKEFKFDGGPEHE